jgi:hypothetical protein
MVQRKVWHAFVALILMLTFFAPGTAVIAGTTGTLTGVLQDATTQAPLAGVRITVASPSQTATATTDASGHFSFLSLAPDTYLVSAQKPGYDSVTLQGVTIQADTSQSITLNAQKALQQIGRTSSRAASDLVKPGTTADVYSIDPTQQDKFQGLGGGGLANSAWSSMSSIPGIFIAPNQNGYVGASSTVSIRGGDYDQIGYEIDGVPVNRAFDNYPSGPLSALGQQQVQVYTGAAPANAQAQGLSGYINQVIKTGTYPGFLQFDASVGGPAPYQKFSLESGGATNNRNFSWYVGLGGYTQDFRLVDQFNGASITNTYGIAIAPCAPGSPAPSCYNNGVYNGNTPLGSFVLGGPNLFSTSMVTDRNSVVNLHFGFPRASGLKDDVQVLAVIDYLRTNFYDSTNDQGGATYLNNIGLGQPFYIDGYNFNAPLGTALPANYQALASQYPFPNSAAHAFQAAIPINQEDYNANNQNIFKLQYTHPFSDSVLLKVYGYSYYSNWFNFGPQSGYADFFGANSLDYELWSHTRGVNVSLLDQINSRNLVTFETSLTAATTVRDNNTQFVNGLYGTNTVNTRTLVTALVDSSNPLNGLCYTAAGAATTCSLSGPAQFGSIGQAVKGTIAPAVGVCGGGPCENLVVGNGQYATYNAVKPNFFSMSLTDQMKATDKLNIDFGVRLDSFGYGLSDTSQSAARTFFYNSFNLDTCLDANNNLFDKVLPVGGGGLGLASPNSPCPAGFKAANFTNPVGVQNQTFTVWQPRIAFTYTVSPSTVVRGSYGRYTQAPNSAFEQYDTLQANAPAQLYGVYSFQKFGFTTPDHPIVPPTSNNYDVSLEHQFAGGVSLKLSPFYRSTQNQIQQFFLNQQTGFVSGLNVGQQTSKGFEFELDKGNFAREGFAAKLAFTYTNSTIRYTNLASGGTILDPLNNAITTYNDFTKFCATNPGDAKCGSAAGAATAAPCYTTTGVADPACAATSVANPYWNAPVQALLSPSASYPAFDIFPGGLGSSVQAYGAPYVGTFIGQWKKGKLAIIPAIQFFAGQKYGAPLTTFGVAPNACTATLAGTTTGDPRYNYGAVGGAPFDASKCTTLAGIPDPYTKVFDGLGGFTAPSQLLAHLQFSYDVSDRVTLTATFANLINRCFGGSQNGFQVAGACSYGVVEDGFGGDIGNVYNPGQAIQPVWNTPYFPSFAGGPSPSQGSPFSFFVNARVKL